MFFTKYESIQSTVFPIIIVYLLMFLILSIFIVWICGLIRWLRKNQRRNQSPITNQIELKEIHYEEDVLYDEAFLYIQIHRTRTYGFDIK